MSALAHYLEGDGLATTLVALVREHAQAMRPPRALWVPFELGRPFGAPGNAAQQLRVLRAALALLDRPGPGPLLEDFADADANPGDDPDWRFAAALDADDAIAEAHILEELWRVASEQRGFTTVGISGFSPREAVEFIARYFDDEPMPNPAGMARVSRARYAIDDIKAAYLETAAQQGGQPSSRQLLDWLWETTRAGTLLRNFNERAHASEDRNLRLISGSLVPAERTIRFRGR